MSDHQHPPGAPDQVGAAERWDAYVEAVLDVVESIPPGRVMAYGQIADLLGSGGPRQVGRVMSLHGGAVPWWRVVTAAGRPPPGHEQTALERLRAEGTPLRGDHVDMGRATWGGGPPQRSAPTLP